MDQREPPRTPETEGRPRDPVAGPLPRRFARLVPPPSGRRFPTDRLALAGLGGLVAAALLWVAVPTLARWAVAYVRDHPTYRLTYRDITLDPPPPPWFRGGSAAFLDHVFGGPGGGRSFSTLDTDLKRLGLAFRRDPWVVETLGAEVVGPNRVVVRLKYREPVAYVGDRPESAEFLVDADAALLPPEGVSVEAARPLVRLYRFDPPAEPRWGEAWNRTDPGTGLATPEPRARAAARLAAFLRARILRDAKDDPAWRTVMIHRWLNRGTAVQVGDNLMFRWQEPGNVPASQQLSDDARWNLVRDWVRRHPPEPGGKPADLKLTPGGVAEYGPPVGVNRPPQAGPW